MSTEAIPFVHLGARSDISLGESIARVEELCWEAARDHQGYLALTDVNSVGRAPAFSAAAARAGLRPIFGAEIDVLPFGDIQYRGRCYRMRLLVEDQYGWRNLLRLVNHARSNESDGRPAHTTFSRLLEDNRGLLFFLGGEKGELTALLKSERYERIEEIVGTLQDSGCLERCFFELPPIDTEADLALAEKCNAAALHFQLLPIIVPKVVCAHSNDDVLFRLLNHREDDLQPRRLGDVLLPAEMRQHLQPRRVIEERYAAFPDALEVTLEVARHCSNFALPQPDRRFPIHDFVRGVDAESYIWNTAFAKANERQGELSARYKERLDREFREITDAGLANAVVTLTRLVEELETSGVQRGPGGGLFTNSLIASLMGLTGFDPLQFDLNFQIPPGLTAGSFPMLEISVPQNQEGEAVGTLERLFSGQVLPVGRWECWKFNTAFEHLATLLGKDHRWVLQMTRKNGFSGHKQRLSNEPVTYSPPSDSAIDSPETLAWFACRLEGRSRRLTALPGVYTFSVEDMACSVPHRRLPFGGSLEFGLPVTEWTSEELGQLRHGRITFQHPCLLDLVGEATAIAREQGNIDYAPERTPLDDQVTYDLLRTANTAGIQPLESPLIRKKLRQGQPSDLNSLIRVLTQAGSDDNNRLDLPTVLLSHLCAAVKAHHPVAFFAAALNGVGEEKRRLGLILEEIRNRNIRINDLDINYSGWRWNAERESLRPGFIMVKGMTAEAGMEIVGKRREMHFSDLAELCQQTDQQKLKAKHLKTLLFAGALDTWGTQRTVLAQQLEEFFPMLRSKNSKTALGTTADDYSFFGRDAGWWVKEYGQQEGITHDDPREKEAQEKESLGFALHPVPLEGVEKFLKVARVKNTSKLTLRDKNQAITLVGTMGPLDADPRHPNATLVDVNGCLVRGSGELAGRLSAPEWAGEELLITGILERDNLQWRIELESVYSIAEAYHDSRCVENLTLDLSAVPESNWKDLHNWLAQYPGRIPVAMEWLPADAPRLLRKIAARRVTFCPLLVHGLNRYAGVENWKLKGTEEIVHQQAPWEQLVERVGLLRLKKMLAARASG